MGYLAIGLLILGITLLFVEIFVPGFGVFGVTGLFALFFSAAVTIMYIKNGPMIVITGVIIIAVFAYLAIEYAKKHKLYGKLILNDTLEEAKNNKSSLEALIDKKGVVKTPLKPHGKVDFNGTVVEAYSDGDFLSAGQKVVAYKVHEDSLYVKKV